LGFLLQAAEKIQICLKSARTIWYFTSRLKYVLLLPARQSRHKSIADSGM